MTYRAFIDDIMVALGMIHDDSLWSRDNILSNVVYGVSLLGTQSLARDLGASGDGISGIHQRTVVCVPLKHVECSSSCEWDHSYFDLPSEVYDLPYGGGVTMIRYAKGCGCKPSVAGVTFSATSLEALTGLYGTAYQNPREDRPYFARYTSEDGKDRVGVFGVSPLVTKLLVGLLYAPKFDKVDFDDDMPIDPHQLHDLKRLVLNMSIWPLGIPQERLKNDGRDFEPETVINTRPIISVNDPILNSNTQQQ